MKPNIVEFLSKLSATELQEVIAHAKAMQSVTSHTINLPMHSDADFILSTISDYCRHYQLDYRRSHELKPGKTFANKVETITKFIELASDRRVEQRAFLWMCLELLHKAWKPEGQATNCTFFMNNLHRVPGVVDTAFPAYASAGLLPSLVKVMTSK